MSLKSLKRHEGWLMIDHTASAGLPDHIARAAGYDPKHCGEGAVFEAATLTCSHCKQSYVKNRFRIRAREFCKKCDHYICDKCGMLAAQPGYVHTPFIALVENQGRPAVTSIIVP